MRNHEELLLPAGTDVYLAVCTQGEVYITSSVAEGSGLRFDFKPALSLQGDVLIELRTASAAGACVLILVLLRTVAVVVVVAGMQVRKREELAEARRGDAEQRQDDWTLTCSNMA